ncbi:hypothetical protein F5B17DRAFT_152923 [Nemania serpens]|nr:hypothetical protein F5B17DRAFT_152923 [Nemania serpens]
MLHSVLDMGSSTEAFAVVDFVPLGAALSRLDYTIQELQSALKQVETDSKASEDGRRISKIKWQVYKSQVAQLRDEVRHRKQELVDKIGLLQLAVRYVDPCYVPSFSTDRTSVRHTGLLPSAYVRAEISNPEHMISSSGEPQPTVPLRNRRTGPLEVGTHSRISWCCSASCSCRCHQLSAMNSQPWPLSTLRQLLSLFARATCWETRLCDDRVCRDASQQYLSVVYQTPLLNYAVWLRLAWTSLFGPGASLHLRVARIVTDITAFNIARCGAVWMLQREFEERRALPNDTLQCGRCLLHVSHK